MKSALAILAKLARQEVDLQRQELASNEARLTSLHNTRNTVQSARTEAIEIASSTGEDLSFWAGIVEGGRRHGIAIAQGIDEQEVAVGAARDVLTDRYIELRRLEMLADRRTRASLLRMQADEQAELAERTAQGRTKSALTGWSRKDPGV